MSFSHVVMVFSVHRSIMERNKLPKIPCSVVNFVCGVNTLNREHRNLVGTLGLGSLLEIKEVKMRKSLLNFLIESYNATNDKFEIGMEQCFSITNLDVEMIMGLINDGVVIQPDQAITADNVPEIPKPKLTNKGFSITQMLANVISIHISDHDFFMSFVLLALGTILAPVSTQYIPFSYFALVRDIATVQSINWNAFTLEFLKANLVKMNDATRANHWPAGNLAIMQV